MAKLKHVVKLSKQERKTLKKFVSKGKHSAREIKRARILLLSDEGIKSSEIESAVEVSRVTVFNLRKKFCTREYKHILDFLKDDPRSGAPIKVDSEVEAKIAMIACSDPPEGFSKWTLRMIADKVVELEYTDSISHEEVRRVLKKTNSNPGLKHDGA